MQKQLQIKIRAGGLAFVIALLTLLVSPLPANAENWREDFDSKSIGTLSVGTSPSSYDDWFYGMTSGSLPSASVTSLVSNSSPNSVGVGGGNRSTRRQFGDSSQIAVEFQMYWEPALIDGPVTGFVSVSQYNATNDIDGVSPSGTGGGLSVDTNGRLSWGSSGYDFHTLTTGWTKVRMDFTRIATSSSYLVEFWVNGSYATSTTGMSVTHTGDFPYVFDSLDISSGNGRVLFLDDIEVWTDSDVPPAPGACTENGGICILETTPENGASGLATSTAFEIGAYVYIAPEEYVEDMQLMISYQRQTNTAGMAVSYSQLGTAPHSGVFYFPITSAGYHSFSTTTAIVEEGGLTPVGDYLMHTEILLPDDLNWFETIFSWIGFPVTGDERILYLNTMFNVVEKSGIDVVYDIYRDALTGELDLDFGSCEIAEFDLSKCLISIVVPSGAQMQSLADQLINDSLTKVPFGYITRFVQIITSGEAVLPPDLTYTYGTSGPDELEGKTFSINVFEAFTIVPTIEADDGSGKNVWDIIMPYVEMIVALGVFGVILADIIQMGMPDFGAIRGESRRMKNKLMGDSDINNMKVNDLSHISETEWQNLKRNRLI